MLTATIKDNERGRGAHGVPSARNNDDMTRAHCTSYGAEDAAKSHHFCYNEQILSITALTYLHLHRSLGTAPQQCRPLRRRPWWTAISLLWFEF
eukprot:scaffold4392_cov138-Skeletonema_marinoi.AAC.26